LAEKTIKTRNADATKEAILEAARIAFSEKGMDGAGVREIAEAAGCNAALVNRYFGGKEQLFAAALVGAFDMNQLLELPKEDFAEAMANYMVSKRTECKTFDPMFLALRSISNPSAMQLVQAEIQRHVTDVYADWLDGENCHQRAALIGSFFAGFYLSRFVMGSKSLSFDHDEVLAPMIAKTLQGYIDG